MIIFKASNQRRPLLICDVFRKILNAMKFYIRYALMIENKTHLQQFRKAVEQHISNFLSRYVKQVFQDCFKKVEQSFLMV